MKPTCQIQWVDAMGTPTPDTNPAVGVVHREAYVDDAGRPFPRSKNFYICAKHKREFDRERLIGKHWRFITLAQAEKLERHRAADPYCTCNNCIDYLESQQS